MRPAGEPPVLFGIAAATLGLVVLLPVALIVAWRGFDGMYGQDSFAYVNYASGPLADALRRLDMPPDFLWPPGYPLLAAIVGLFLPLGPTAAQVVSLLAGALVPVFVALLGREVIPQQLGHRARDGLPLLAGLVVALTGQLWQSSVVTMGDTSAVALATCGAWATCRYVRHGSRWALALAASAVVLAVETRLIYGLVALPLGALGLSGVARAYRQTPARAAGDLLLGGAVALAVAGPTLVPILRASLDGLPPPFLAGLAINRWDPLSIVSSTFVNYDGRLDYALPTGLFYLLQPVQHYWFTLLGLLAIPGALAVTRWRSLASGAVLIAWPLLVVGFLVGGAYQNTRFFLAAAPPLAILIAAGVGWMWQLARSVTGPRRVLSPALIAAGLSLLLLANGALAARFTMAFIGRFQEDNASIRGLVARVPDEARLITLGPTNLLAYDGRPGVVELSDLDESSIVTLLEDGVPSYLLVDIDAMHRQWMVLGSGRAVAVLEAAGRLRFIDRSTIWTLYEIGPSG